MGERPLVFFYQYMRRSGALMGELLQFPSHIAPPGFVPCPVGKETEIFQLLKNGAYMTNEKKESTCAWCEGSGYTVGSQAGCCGNPTTTGECCGNAIEEQCQLQCEVCGGSGELPVISAKMLPEKNLPMDNIIIEALAGRPKGEWFDFTAKVRATEGGYIVTAECLTPSEISES